MLVRYPGGKLKSCTISVALTIDSVQCDRLSQVELTPDGTIVRCEWVPLVDIGESDRGFMSVVPRLGAPCFGVDYYHCDSHTINGAGSVAL